MRKQIKNNTKQVKKIESRLEIIFKEGTEVSEIAALIYILSIMKIVEKVEANIISNVKKKK